MGDRIDYSAIYWEMGLEYDEQGPDSRLDLLHLHRGPSVRALRKTDRQGRLEQEMVNSVYR